MTDQMRVFDRALVARRRARAAARVDQVAPILEDAADRLLDRLDDTTRRFTRALDLGGRGFVAPKLAARGIPFIVSADLAPTMAVRGGGLAVAADEEFLPFAEGAFDLVVASLSLHWVNDLPGALIQIRRALAPDGLFLASLPGLPSFGALRSALAEVEAELRGGISPRISPFPELRDGAALLQRAGFALPVADAEDMALRYKSAFGIFADLRAAGEANAVLARDGRTPPRALFPMVAARLGGAEVDLPLRLLVLTGWAPSPTQQKPARPGSATARLADALGATEISTGEKAGKPY